MFRAAMGAPIYDQKTLDAFFQPLSEASLRDPIVGPIARRLSREDPDIIAAVAEVDRSQIRRSLALAPLQRLEVSHRLAAALSSFRNVSD